MRSRTFTSFFWVAVALQIAVAVGLVFVAAYVIREVGDQGLKNVVERIWEGPSNGDAVK